jgi:flagellar hook-length control protein FliK
MEASISNHQVAFTQPQTIDTTTKETMSEGQENGFKKLLDEKSKEQTDKTLSTDLKIGKKELSKDKLELEIPIEALNNTSLLDAVKLVLFRHIENKQETVIEEAIIEETKTEEVKIKNVTIPALALSEEVIQKEMQQKDGISKITDFYSQAVSEGLNQETKVDTVIIPTQREDIIKRSAQELKSLEVVPEKETKLDTEKIEHIEKVVKMDTQTSKDIQPIILHNQDSKISDIVQVKVEKPEEIPQKILDTLVSKVTTREKEFEILLEPGNLGKIAIKVAYEQERTIISIACSNEKTMELLTQSAKEIGTIIEMNMGSPTTIFVDKSEENYLNQENNNQPGQEQKQQKEQSEQNTKGQKDESLDFIQQLRLGLISGMEMQY